MKKEVCVFNGNEVSFVMEKEHKMMVNATEMANIFNKYPKDFLILDGTKRFIDICLNSCENGNLGVQSEEDLYTSKQKTGTWLHRVLALKFAAWLDPAFELWVYCTVENLLFGRHVRREQSFERTIALQKEMDDLRYKPYKTGEDFERYLQIQREIRQEQAVRKSLTTESLSGIKSLF